MVVAHTPDDTLSSAALAAAVTAIVVLAVLTLYLVGFDQGAVSRTGMFMHELMHDGRHLLGLPCH
ncbi:CbtB domain-containing protein [Rhodococcus coprophilus]|uniref:Membrane protein n=1 Tax=Rhodococcus coprophilus TaxID=38310 RepID=A0A2X4XIN0_9NOCA|nr:CbtB domain-containing protein [Rhodococcus coprophilus]MBM7459552.1 hypothetical protein [Rhodococcus coprophilus]SQI36464.1 membrane protein [Rhodococcus coprophilus]